MQARTKKKKNITTFKKKNMENDNCFTYGNTGLFSRECLDAK